MADGFVPIFRGNNNSPLSSGLVPMPEPDMGYDWLLGSAGGWVRKGDGWDGIVVLVNGEQPQIAPLVHLGLHSGGDVVLSYTNVDWGIELTIQSGGGPPPNPTPNDGDFDCKLAGYFVKEVVRVSVQFAINDMLGVSTGFGWVFVIADVLPFGGVWLSNIGEGIVGVIETIGLSRAIQAAEDFASDHIWNLVGCIVYNAVKDIHAFTGDNWQRIIDDLNAVPMPMGALTGWVAVFMEATGWLAANGLSKMAYATDYDCSACAVVPTDGTGMDTGPQPTNGYAITSRGLTVSDTVVFQETIGEIDFPTSTVIGVTGSTGGHDYRVEGPHGYIASVVPYINVLQDGATGATGQTINIKSGLNTTAHVARTGDNVDISIDGTGGGGSGTLEVTDGTTDLPAVTRLHFVGGVLTGIPGDATLTMAAPTAPGAFTSYSAALDVPKQMAQNVPEVILSVAVPAGNYLVSASITVRGNTTIAGNAELTLADDMGDIRHVNKTVGILAHESMALPTSMVNLHDAGHINLRMNFDQDLCVVEALGPIGQSPNSWMDVQRILGPVDGATSRPMPNPPAMWEPWTPTDVDTMVIDKAPTMYSLTESNSILRPSEMVMRPAPASFIVEAEFSISNPVGKWGPVGIALSGDANGYTEVFGLMCFGPGEYNFTFDGTTTTPGNNYTYGEAGLQPPLDTDPTAVHFFLRLEHSPTLTAMYYHYGTDPWIPVANRDDSFAGPWTKAGFGLFMRRYTGGTVTLNCHSWLLYERA